MQLLLNIDVPDIDTASAFYTQAFGLQLGRSLFAGQVRELLGAPMPIYLLAKAAGTVPFAGSTAERSYQPHWTPLHLDLQVEDLDDALARALAAGARQEGPIQNQAWGRLVGLRDPFGHGCCLLQWRGQGYAEVDDAQHD
ncbi:VOC family protein [Pseudomonas sp. EA_35y_Pfl2_R111]|uniref:VOC family protein n=1 Tax=Pseudomonas sp. EA_35y_Pfl2_R111 TaxID=3088689 RepID=UPI0030DAC3BF